MMNRFFRRVAVSTVAMAALAALAGCDGPQSLRTGATLAEATAGLGAPTGRYPRAGGERLEYARGPYGRHTYMLDFDTQGRPAGWEQVLTEAKFETLRAGASRDEVLFMLGHPSDQRMLAWQKRTLWSYRYDHPFCRWFQVGLDVSGRVVDTGYGPDPLCEDMVTASP